MGATQIAYTIGVYTVRTIVIAIFLTLSLTCFAYLFAPSAATMTAAMFMILVALVTLALCSVYYVVMR